MEDSYGCGSPVGLGELVPGESMLDLGCGGGIDCFIASRKVGPDGRVIGVDMTENTLARAERNAEILGRNLGYGNVEFRRGTLEEVPFSDEEIDLVISNCVINLSPDKLRVLGEMHRVLRDGGRFVISDIVSGGPVPQRIRQNQELWGHCIAGALGEKELQELLLKAGFYGLEVLKRYLYREVEGLRFFSLTVRGRKSSPRERTVSSSVSRPSTWAPSPRPTMTIAILFPGGAGNKSFVLVVTLGKAALHIAKWLVPSRRLRPAWLRMTRG